MLTKQNFYDYDFRIDGWAGWAMGKKYVSHYKILFRNISQAG